MDITFQIRNGIGAGIKNNVISMRAKSMTNNYARDFVKSKQSPIVDIISSTSESGSLSIENLEIISNFLAIERGNYYITSQLIPKDYVIDFPAYAVKCVFFLIFLKFRKILKILQKSEIVSEILS